MNYSRFGAIRELESEQAVAPLRGHAGTAVRRHCLRQKKGDLHIPTQEKFFKCIIIHEGATYVCMYVLIMYLNNVQSCCRAYTL